MYMIQSMKNAIHLMLGVLVFISLSCISPEMKPFVSQARFAGADPSIVLTWAPSFIVMSYPNPGPGETLMESKQISCNLPSMLEGWDIQVAQYFSKIASLKITPGGSADAIIAEHMIDPRVAGLKGYKLVTPPPSLLDVLQMQPEPGKPAAIKPTPIIDSASDLDSPDPKFLIWKSHMPFGNISKTLWRSIDIKKCLSQYNRRFMLLIELEYIHAIPGPTRTDVFYGFNIHLFDLKEKLLANMFSIEEKAGAPGAILKSELARIPSIDHLMAAGGWMVARGFESPSSERFAITAAAKFGFLTDKQYQEEKQNWINDISKQ